MGDFSDSFRLDKMRSGNPLIYILREEFENFSSSPQRVDVCESIARCFYQLGQYNEAAEWFETAGRLIMVESGTERAVKALNAVTHYERALECYKIEEDDEKFSECSALLSDLRRACASA